MSKIEWTDSVWEPVGGCRHASEGCRNCYAETLIGNLSGITPSRFRPIPRRYDGLAQMRSKRSRFTGEIAIWPDELVQPLSWRKPRTVFVCSQSDLFYEKRPFEHVAAVYAVMAASAWVGAARKLRTPMTTGAKLLVLTKRASRRKEFFRWLHAEADRDGIPVGGVLLQCLRELLPTDYTLSPEHVFAIQDATLPLPNVGEGVSVEDQATADERIPVLLATPAAMRFVSYEPALAGIDISTYLPREAYIRPDADVILERRDWIPARIGVDWVIAGAESGPGARPAKLDWFRAVRDQCQRAGVAYFLKQADVCDNCDGRIDVVEQLYGGRLEWRCNRCKGTGRAGKVRKHNPALDGHVHDARPAWLT